MSHCGLSIYLELLCSTVPSFPRTRSQAGSTGWSLLSQHMAQSRAGAGFWAVSSDLGEVSLSLLHPGKHPAESSASQGGSRHGLSTTTPSQTQTGWAQSDFSQCPVTYLALGPPGGPSHSVLPSPQGLPPHPRSPPGTPQSLDCTH